MTPGDFFDFVPLERTGNPAKSMKQTDRDAVIDAALTLFRMNGYHNTSMADISASCGLLKGSIYHYFPGKKELAIAALDRVIAETREKLFRPALDPSVPAEVRDRVGIGDGVVRLSVGLEELEDLREDLAQALQRRATLRRRKGPSGRL